MVTRLSPAAQGHLAMLAFSALVAGSFSLGVMAANDIAPTSLNAVRFAIAAAIVGTLAWSRGELTRRLIVAPWRYAILGLLLALYFVMMFEGLKTAAPVSAAAVFTLNPLIAAIAGAILVGQVITGRLISALLIGAVGALWVIFRADINALLGFHVGQGEFIYFWGVVAHAIYSPMVRLLNRGDPVIASTFATMLASGVIIVGYGWQDILATDWMALPPIVWITIIYVSIFASSITFVILQFASMRLPSAKVMAYTYLTPSWVLVWEILLGHGVPPMWVLGGVGLTLVALWMLVKPD